MMKGSCGGVSGTVPMRETESLVIRRGHNLPQERPEECARAVLDARAMAQG